MYAECYFFVVEILDDIFHRHISRQIVGRHGTTAITFYRAVERLQPFLYAASIFSSQLSALYVNARRIPLPERRYQMRK